MVSTELAPECDNSPVVHVCISSVSHYTKQLTHMGTWLSPDEQARAQRFLKEPDRMRFILGRATVRCLCGAHLGISPARVLLAQTSAGKPYLANPIPADRKRFEFNIAHSGDCVLVAWTEERAVGVDVEAFERYGSVSFNDVPATAFSAAERAALAAAKPDEVIPTFYRIWVRKEAVLKGEGCGIAGALRSFSVACRHVSRTEWLDEVHYPESGRTWRIVDLIPAPDHLAAIALPQGSVVHQYTPPNI
jgi:4'-phosphopantetheinyl transferase